MKRLRHSFIDYISPISRALRKGYNLERVNLDKELKIKFPKLTTHRLLATNLDIPDKFKKINLEYDLEEQGRDLLDVALGAAFQYGYQQAVEVLTIELEKEIDMCKLLENWNSLEERVAREIKNLKLKK